MHIKCTLYKCKIKITSIVISLYILYIANKLLIQYILFNIYYCTSVVSCCSNLGYFCSTSNHVSLPLDKSLTTFGISSNCNSNDLIFVNSTFLCFKNCKMPTYICSNLTHAVSFAKCSSMRCFQSVKIYGDTKWYCNLICPCVSASNTTG